nr:two-component system histidine kinase [uncultured bacterium]
MTVPWTPRLGWPDGVVALCVTIFLTLGTPLVPRGRGIEAPLDLPGYLLLACSGLVLLYRRRYPTAVVLATTLLTIVYYAAAYPGFFQPCAFVIALYTVTSLGYRWLALVTGIGMCAGLTIIASMLSGDADGRILDAPLWVGGWLAAAIVAAETARHRRAYLNEVEQRAADALRTKEEAARLRATEERLRIARELHDSLTHAISLVNVQVGLAVHLFDRDRESSRTALLSVKDASRQAMRELRSTLEVLRKDDEEPDGPSLDQIGELIRKSERPGLDITLRVSGDRQPLPREVDHAAYRIVQESLTNAVRHANTPTLSVEVAYQPQHVTMRIEDEGKVGQPVREGVGIRGMRERVAALGGELHVGPKADGGFAVVATLPLPDKAGKADKGDEQT